LGTFLANKMQLVKRELRLTALCRIKLITSNNYSPTNKSLFCLLKLLTQNCKSKGNRGTSPDRMREGQYVITAHMLLNDFTWLLLRIVTGKM